MKVLPGFGAPVVADPPPVVPVPPDEPPEDAVGAAVAVAVFDAGALPPMPDTLAVPAAACAPPAGAAQPQTIMVLVILLTGVMEGLQAGVTAQDNALTTTSSSHIPSSDPSMTAW